VELSKMTVMPAGTTTCSPSAGTAPEAQVAGLVQ
jgi:hypothetical protein